MLKPMLRRMVERSLVLAGIMEDLPYPDNRVTIGSDQRSTQLYYRIQPTEQARIERFRDRVREALRPYKVQIVKPVSYTHLDVYKRQGLRRWRGVAGGAGGQGGQAVARRCCQKILHPRALLQAARRIAGGRRVVSGPEMSHNATQMQCNGVQP